MPTYLGWTVVTMPSTPWPKSLELRDKYIAAASTNPFTGQQQVHDWAARWKELSASYPSMTQSQAANWVTFLESCNGIMNVFQFPSAVCAAFPESLTSDGTTPRYWRLKSNESGWGIKVGSIYSFTFECREAL
jgi:hypothetical protein